MFIIGRTKNPGKRLQEILAEGLDSMYTPEGYSHIRRQTEPGHYFVGFEYEVVGGNRVSPLHKFLKRRGIAVEYDGSVSFEYKPNTPMEPEDAKKWLRRLWKVTKASEEFPDISGGYPIKVNGDCGTHLHVSQYHIAGHDLSDFAEKVEAYINRETLITAFGRNFRCYASRVGGGGLERTSWVHLTDYTLEWRLCRWDNYRLRHLTVDMVVRLTKWLDGAKTRIKDTRDALDLIRITAARIKAGGEYV